jgi:hypothetical protein
MTGKLNSRSAYDRASPVSRGICGSPAAAIVIGRFFCVAPMQRRDHGAILNLISELHLVEEKHHARVLRLSGRGVSQKELGQIAGALKSI